MGWSAVLLKVSDQPKRQQREAKVLGVAGMEFLEDFEYVLYHDSHRGPRVHATLWPGPEQDWRCWLHKMISDTMQPLLRKEVDIVYFGHPDRNSTAKEFLAIAAKKLCTKDSLQTALQLHTRLGYPDNMGLSETAVLARRWSSSSLQRSMREWWMAMVDTDCMRDQLNFEFALWKSKVKYRRMPSLDFPFIKLHAHDDPNKIRFRVTA